jgi:hypothetical protein
MRTTPIFAAAFLLLAGSIQAATTLFSNVNQTNAGGGNYLNTGYRYASDFQTDAFSATITGATLYVANFDTGTAHTFTASIFTDNSGTPGTLVGSFNAFSVPLNTPFANYSTTSTGISLAANTIYWEVLQMNEADVSSGPQWGETSSQATDAGSVYTTVPATALKSSTNSGSSYADVTSFGSPVQGNYQFALTGTESVPEPSPALLSSAGLGAMLLLRRRRS